MARRLVVGSFLVVLAILVAGYAVTDWAHGRWERSRAQYEAEIGSLDLSTWELPDLPPERNAATWIAKGTALLVLANGTGSDSKMSAIVAKRASGWSPEETAVLRETIATNREGLGVLDRARGLEASSFEIRLREGAKAKLPRLVETVNAARLVFARGALAHRDGNRAAAIADVELLGTIARALERERTILVVLTGVAVERLQFRLAGPLSEDPAATVDEIHRIAAHLIGDDLDRALSRAAAADGVVMCSELLRDSTAAVRDEANAYTPPLTWRLLRPLAGEVFGALCLDSYRAVLPTIERPFSERDEDFHRALLQLRASWVSRIISDAALPNLLNGTQRTWLNLEHRRLTLAATELRVLSLKNGTYPESLDELSARASADPSGPGGWLYERLPDGSARLSAPPVESLAKTVLVGTHATVLPFTWTLPPPRSRPPPSPRRAAS